MSILAWRYWQYWKEADNIDVLVGSFGTEWVPEKVNTARCRAYVNDMPNPCLDTTPGTGCSCGIYALRQPVELDGITLYEPKRTHFVQGIVQIWGKIISAECGYRAQHASIIALVDVPASVTNRYQVPNLPSVEYARQEYFP